MSARPRWITKQENESRARDVAIVNAISDRVVHILYIDSIEGIAGRWVVEVKNNFLPFGVQSVTIRCSHLRKGIEAALHAIQKFPESQR